MSLINHIIFLHYIGIDLRLREVYRYILRVQNRYPWALFLTCFVIKRTLFFLCENIYYTDYLRRIVTNNVLTVNPIRTI